MRTETGFLNRNLMLCLSRVRFLFSSILKPSKQDSMWGEAVLVFVSCCGAVTAGGDGCESSAVALAGHRDGALAGALFGNAKGAWAGSATARKLLSAIWHEKRGWAGWEP